MRSTTDFSIHDRLGYRLSVLVRRWRQVVDAQLESYGLSQATWRPLIHLASIETRSSQPPRQCELAEALQIGGPALVRLLDSLEAKGLVERVDVSGDRRANHVQLTREGKKLARRVYDIIVGVERALLREVEPGALAELDRGLAQITDAVERRLEAPNATPTARRRA